jgi:choline dehydrogenase-like flavoprotein
LIVDAGELDGGTVLDADVAVVGAGPMGIVTAVEVARAGFDVLLVESGGRRFRQDAQRLGDPAGWDPSKHSAMGVSTRRQLGGASILWGGRCVPYDPVDFDRRAFAGDVEWPVSYGDVSRWLQPACDWLLCGRATFDAGEVPELRGRSLVPGLPDGDVTTSTVERWSLPVNFGRHHAELLSGTPRLRALTGLTCVEIACEDAGRRVAWLKTRTLDRKAVRVRARKYVVAGGGLESTRLLMASDRHHPGGIGNHSGHLGRWYMAHVDGRIARARFTTPPEKTIYGHEQDSEGVFLRRRFAFSRRLLRERELPNFAAWLVNPELADPSHSSPVLSLAYLTLRSPLGSMVASEQFRNNLTLRVQPGSRRAHLRNVARAPGTAARFAFDRVGERVRRRRRPPGFFVYNPANTYPLHYHAEQAPTPDSRVTLAAETDPLGMRRLNIDLRFSERDVDGVIRAHRHIDEYLREHGVGRLEYLADDLEASVWSQANGGRHQIGTTRMSKRAEDGVVDGDLAVHGFDDLFVASSSSFVTSGQAGPMLTGVAFALRLADHLAGALR